MKGDFMPLFILELVLALILLVFLFTQLVLPYFGFFKGRIFWLFRNNEDIVDEKIEKLGELEVQKEQTILDKEITVKTEELEKLKSTLTSSVLNPETPPVKKKSRKRKMKPLEPKDLIPD
jgi:hypothetical protein